MPMGSTISGISSGTPNRLCRFPSRKPVYLKIPSTSSTSATHSVRCSFLRFGSRSMRMAKNQHRAVSSRSSITYRGPAQLKNTIEKMSMAIFFFRTPRSAACETRFSARKRNTNSRLENTISSSPKI